MQSHATETNQILWFYSFFRFSIWKNYFQLSALPLFTLLRGPCFSMQVIAVYVRVTWFSILQGLTDKCSGYLTIIQWGWVKKICRSGKMLSAEVGSSLRVVNSEIRTILPHIIRRPNSITVLSFIQKFSKFLTN